MGKAVNHHGGDEPSVMGVLAKNWSRGNEVSPDAVNRRGVIEPEEQPLKIDEISEGLSSRFPKPVDVGRASGDDPELIKILGHDVEVVGLANEESHRIKGFLMHGMRWIDKTGQNIRINEIIHSIRRDPRKCFRGCHPWNSVERAASQPMRARV